MRILRERFEPYPEAAEVVDSLLEVDLDEDDVEDGDDSLVPESAPGLIGRLLKRPPSYGR